MKIYRSIALMTLVLMSFGVGLSQAPLPPTNLTIQPGMHGGVMIRWDSSAGALGYKVFKAVDTSNFIRIAIVIRPGFFDWAIFPNHTYYYFVKAVNLSGDSSPSDTVSYTLGPPPPVHGIIRGIVTDDSTGLPIKDAVVRFFKPNGRWSTHTFTNFFGLYRIALDTGRYLIQVQKYGYLAEWFDNVHRRDSAMVIPLGQDTVTANFDLRPLPPVIPVNVTGNVSDSVTGLPLANAFVAFMRPHRGLRILEHMTGFFGGFDFERHEIPELGRLHGVVWIGRTDTLGNYNAHMPKGLRYIAVAFKPGYIPEFFNDKRSPFDADRILLTSDTSNINFALTPNPDANNSISGMVVDSSGSGIPSHVVLLRKTPFGRFPVRFRTTDSLGNYSFSKLVEGDFYIRVIPIDGYAPAWYVDNECGVANWRHADTIHVSGDITGIDVCVVPISSSGFASISGQILGGSNLLTTTPVQGVTVYAISSSTNEVVGYDITEDDGVYSLENVPAGSYNIEVDKEGYSTTSPLSVSVDESNNFEMTDAVINVTSDPPVSVGDISTLVPLDYRLYHNYPNPFNPTTEFRIDIPKTSHITLKIYNILGQEVTSLANDIFQAGVYKLTWDGVNSHGELVSSGIYLIKFKGTSQEGDGHSFSQTRKVLFLK